VTTAEARGPGHCYREKKKGSKDRYINQGLANTKGGQHSAWGKKGEVKWSGFKIKSMLVRCIEVVPHHGQGGVTLRVAPTEKKSWGGGASGAEEKAIKEGKD